MHGIDEHLLLVVSYWVTLPISVLLLPLLKTTTTPLDVLLDTGLRDIGISFLLFSFYFISLANPPLE